MIIILEVIPRATLIGVAVEPPCSIRLESYEFPPLFLFCRRVVGTYEGNGWQ